MAETVSNWQEERIKAAAARKQLIDDLGLKVDAVFIPWSKSRHAKEKYPSLNWTVTLLKNDKVVLTTTYSAGYGHCPYAKKNPSAMYKWTISDKECIEYECERGVACRESIATGRPITAGLSPKIILPDTLDVVCSLVGDADVISYGTFEEWANSIGYDSDSRKAEATYKQCLELGLKLLNGVGAEGLKALQLAFQNY